MKMHKFLRLPMAAAILGCLLAGCGGGDSHTTDGEQSAPADTTRVNASPRSFSNLSDGTSGHVAQQLGAMSVDLHASLANSDAVLIDADAYTEPSFRAARTALLGHKQVIVDSSSTPPNRAAVAQLIEKLIGEGSVFMPVDAAVLAFFGDDNYTVTPLDIGRDGGMIHMQSLDGGPPSNNSVANVLGLALSPSL